MSATLVPFMLSIVESNLMDLQHSVTIVVNWEELSRVNTEEVIITNNTATSGGRIFLRESTLIVNEPVKIYHNTAQDGGGIYAYSSRVTISVDGKCTWSSNSSK